jgi:hypothetical protein
MKRKIYLFAALIIVFGGCKGIYGLRPYKSLTGEEIGASALEFNIKSNEIAALDTLAYEAYLKEVKDTVLRKFLAQPMQIKIYDSNGKKKWLLVNCEVGGFGNLKWNRYGTFNKVPPFPPLINYWRIDSLMTLEKDLGFYTKVNGERINREDIGAGEFTIIIYWARFMGRQSKRLIEQVQSYKEKNMDKKISVLYVNVDNLYYKAFKKKG